MQGQLGASSDAKRWSLAGTWGRYRPGHWWLSPCPVKYFCLPVKGLNTQAGRNILSVPSLGRATRHNQVAETTRPKWEEASVHAIPATPILTIPSPSSCLYPGPPPPRPISFSVLISQSCTRRELSMGGWFFGFCLFVYLFNLMICKVMFLFLFTLSSSYLTSVWKMILVTVHFFCLLMTIINYQFCVGGVCGAGCLPLTSRLTGTAVPLSQGRPRGAAPTGNTCSHWQHNGLSQSSLPHMCLGSGVACSSFSSASCKLAAAKRYLADSQRNYSDLDHAFTVQTELLFLDSYFNPWPLSIPCLLGPHSQS